MCSVIEEVYRDELLEAKAEGIAEGKAETLREVMKNLKIGLERAMELLGISAVERDTYQRLINEN